MAEAITSDAGQRAKLIVNATGGVNSVSWSASMVDNNASLGGFGYGNPGVPEGASWSITIGGIAVASASYVSYDFGSGVIASPYFPRADSGTLSIGAGTHTVTGTWYNSSTTVGTATITPFTVTVSAPTPAPVFSDSTVSSAGIVNVPYTDAVLASNSPTYSVRNSANTGAGTLPAGLTLNTSTGAITGTPTTIGATSFRIRATNGGGSATTDVLTITISSGGKVWDGNSWEAATTRVWDGNSWELGTTRVWDGNSWEPAT